MKSNNTRNCVLIKLNIDIYGFFFFTIKIIYYNILDKQIITYCRSILIIAVCNNVMMQS